MGLRKRTKAEDYRQRRDKYAARAEEFADEMIEFTHNPADKISVWELENTRYYNYQHLNKMAVSFCHPSSDAPLLRLVRARGLGQKNGKLLGVRWKSDKYKDEELPA